MGLFKALHSLNHRLLSAKLEASDLDSEFSSFLQSYLTKPYQRTRIGNALSDWENVIAGVPQGLILGTLLFNISMNNIFFYTEISDLCNYVAVSTM